MGRNKNMTMSDFYCSQCGRKGIPVWRRMGSEREAGHLKKLYCLHCQKETNFCEIRPFAQKYTINDFWLEYENGNFSPEGNRIMPFGEFKQKLDKEGKLK